MLSVSALTCYVMLCYHCILCYTMLYYVILCIIIAYYMLIAVEVENDPLAVIAVSATPGLHHKISVFSDPDPGNS